MLKYDPEQCAYYEVEAWKAHHIGRRFRLVTLLVRHQMAVFDVGSIVAIRALFFLLPGIRAHNERKKQQAILHVEQYYSLIERLAKKPHTLRLQSAWVP